MCGMRCARSFRPAYPHRTPRTVSGRLMLMSTFQWNSLQDLVAIQEKMNRLFEETIHRTEFPG